MDTPTLSPEELLRQRLSQMLARGVNPAGQPGTNGTAPPAPAPGTGAAANAGSDPTKPAPPTLTPTTTQGNTQPATGATNAPAATVQPKPYQTDEDWAKANPSAVPPAPLDYKAPGWKSTLAHSLAYGAMAFGNSNAGERASQQWTSGLEKQEQDAKTAKQNYPTTLHQAREKEEMGQADLAGKEATTAETVKRTQLMGTEGEPKTTREALERQFRDQTQKGDQNGANTTLDMMKRLYPNEFKSADAEEMAKIPPQVLSQSGPKPVTPEWSAPGQPPKTYNSTAEAQAAWGAKVQELQTKAQSAESKIDPLIESQIGPQPQREHFAVGPTGDAAFATANKAWGVAGEAIKNQMKETMETGNWTLQEKDGKTVEYNSKSGEIREAPAGLTPRGTAKAAQAELDKTVVPVKAAQSYAKDYLENGVFTGPGDEALMEKFFDLAKPSTGFRMTAPQQKMLIDARSYMNSAKAIFHHATSGTWFADDQRKQIVDTMSQLADAKTEAMTQAAKGGAAPAAGAPAGGSQAKPPATNDPLGIR